MGQIKINGIVYGGGDASEITYKNSTVEQKLDTVPIFDITDNTNVNPGSNCLTYGHIIDNVTSTNTDKVLSAKQGKVLKDNINTINSTLGSLQSSLNETVYNMNTKDNQLSSDVQNLYKTKANCTGDKMIYLKYENGFYYIGHDDSSVLV